jgi:predicted metal-dependent peptidase
MGSRSKTKWNDAHDYALNMILKEYAESMGQDSTAFKPWEHQLCDTATYGGMSAEQIYDLLPEQPPGHEPLMADMRPDLSSTADGRKAARGCTAAKTKLKHQWATAVHTAAQMHEQQRNGQGSLPAGVRKYIDSLLNPTVRWDEYLQDYLGERLGEVQMTYSSLNRRSEAAGVILAGRRRRNSPDVTVLWDTSGSQVGWETRVLSEIQGICEELNAEVRVIIIDTAIYADVGIEDAEDIIADVEGGGGSDFRPAFTRLDEESDSSVVLAFTDGYIGVPECPPPQLQDVLWVITEGGVKPADYGSCIHITKNGEVVK